MKTLNTVVTVANVSAAVNAGWDIAGVSPVVDGNTLTYSQVLDAKTIEFILAEGGRKDNESASSVAVETAVTEQVKPVSTRSVVMSMAHKMAKTFTGSYRACFALALKILNRSKAKAVETTSEAVTNTIKEGNSMFSKLTDAVLYVFAVAVMVAAVAFGYFSYTADNEVKAKFHSTTNCVSDKYGTDTCLTKDGEYVKHDKTFGSYEITEHPGVEVALTLQLGARGIKTN